jgi:hypothetical protein
MQFLQMAALILLSPGFSDGTTPAASDSKADDATKAHLVEVYQGDADEYRITLAGDGEQPLKLHRTPVFIWTNPTRQGGQHGAVFVWTRHGRPEVVGTIFTDSRQAGGYIVNHEFHSLALVPLSAQRKTTEVVWQPAEAGVIPQPIPDAPEPARTAPLRLTQMRALAREFTAESVDRRGRWDLRLLPRPIYRYDESSPEVIDGALFTFVTTAGTDPEIVLTVEARQTSDGPRWHYGAVRFSDLNLYLKHQGQQVWSFERGDQGADAEARLRNTYRFLRDRVLPASEEGRE